MLVVDAPPSEILMVLAHTRALVLVDALSYGDRPPDPNVRFLVRPFMRAGLMYEVDGLLSGSG